jgi:replicative DNA helicase
VSHDRTPLNVDLDTERMVLGQILDWPDAFALYEIEGTTADDFWRVSHRYVWEAASACAADGLEVAQPSIVRRLRDEAQIDEVGPAYIGALTEGVPRPTAGTIGPAVRRLRDLAAARRVERLAGQLAEMCAGSRDGLDVDTLAAYVAKLDASLTTAEPGEAGDVPGQIAALGEMLTRGEQRAIALGVPRIDDVLMGGIRPGDVCGIMARTGVGKTMVACHVAHTTAKAGLGQVFVSLEMPTGAIVARLARAAFGWSRYHLQTAWKDHTFPADAYRDLFVGLLVQDAPDLTLQRIEQIVRTRQRRHDVALVTIDYLGLIGADRGLSTYDRISQIAVGLKALAKRCKVAVVVLIQANRAGGQDGSERLTLTAARDAGVVEEALDVLIGMRRVDHSSKVAEAARKQYEDVIWAEVLKHRHGSVSTREGAIRVDPVSLALTEDASLILDEATARQARKATGGY